MWFDLIDHLVKLGVISTNLNRTTEQKTKKKTKKKKKENKKQNKLNNQMSLIQYMFSSHNTLLLKTLFCV